MWDLLIAQAETDKNISILHFGEGLKRPYKRLVNYKGFVFNEDTLRPSDMFMQN